eukprot:GHVU01061575.1.p2 GENE.GHVU01061575.1~~GHVU01061575.1.p2  ORF type:complete len:107 (-),score=9.82 GHVU01061575.1:405-725(-)
MSTTAIAFFVATQLPSGNGKKVYFRGIKRQSFKVETTDNTLPLEWLENTVPKLHEVGLNEPCYFYMAKNPGFTFIDYRTEWHSNDANEATILFIPQNGKEITCRDE